MKKFQSGPHRWRLAARMHGERLFLAADIRQEVVGGMVGEVRRAAGDFGSGSGSGRFGPAVQADRWAFSESVALERLGDLYLRLGSYAKAFDAFRQAALAALGGEAYDHGSDSLPARFLRIRFYRLLDRISSCCAADARLRALLADGELAAEARRLGGRDL